MATPDSINGSAMYKLLPMGEAWPSESEETTLKEFVYGLGIGLDRLEQEASDNLNDAFPGVVGNYLTDWERFLGLPKCPEIELTLQQRAESVLAMWNISPLSNDQFFEDIGSAFGYDITVRSGAKNEFGGGDTDVYNMVVTIIEEPPVYFRAGVSSAGDKLVEFNSSGVSCLLNFFKPAHAYIVFV